MTHAAEAYRPSALVQETTVLRFGYNALLGGGRLITTPENRYFTGMPAIYFIEFSAISCTTACENSVLKTAAFVLS